MVFYQVFLLSANINCKRLRDFEEIEISRQICRGDVNNKKENSLDFCLDFVHEFDCQKKSIRKMTRISPLPRKPDGGFKNETLSKN
jgi:hypothetical protein